VVDNLGLDHPSPWADPRVRVAVERRDQEGDFPLHLIVALGDRGLKARVRSRKATLNALKAFCQAVECDCLFGDDNPNPYLWLLIRQTGQVQRVHIDPGALDQDVLRLAQPALEPSEHAKLTA
jgi:hypothetical protein